MNINMKKIGIIGIAALLFASLGCNKFLSEQSQDEIRPSSVSDLNALMSGSGYPYQDKLCVLLNLLSDDAQCIGDQGNPFYDVPIKNSRPIFTWSKTLFEDMLTTSASANIDSWKTIYGKISGVNTILDYVDKVTGDKAPRENLKGQALAMRAYYYFLLVNLFGQPYNSPTADPAKSPGVPLKLRMQVTDSLYKRNTVAEVYDQVISDFKAGAALMDAYPQVNDAYHFNSLAAYALLSRVYLYQEKWDSVVHYTNLVLSQKSLLANLSTFKGGTSNGSNGYYLYNNGNQANTVFNPTLSSEVLWIYQPTYRIGGAEPASASGENVFFANVLSPAYSLTSSPPVTVSSDLLNLYDARPQSDTGVYLGDLRSRIYFARSTYIYVANGAIAFGYWPYFGATGGLGVRLAEMYLNRAEAYIHKYISEGNGKDRVQALNDINTLRLSRYDYRRTYVPVDISDGQALLAFYKEERRREFPFEGYRWFDLRRYGMPSISHYYQEAPGTGQTYTLAEGDNRYTLPIPQEVLDRNSALTQNP